MKLHLLSAACCAALVYTSAIEPVTSGIEISREDAAKLKSVTCDEIIAEAVDLNAGPILGKPARNKVAPPGKLQVGDLVKLKLTQREETAKPQPDGSLQCFISYNKNPASNPGCIRATVPKVGIDWFTHVPTGSKNPGKTTIAIARITAIKYWPSEIEFVGREIKTDMKGAKIVW